ncbi:glycosyltransferase family 2 protein, partial [Patescibacteria group bacterium]|nr:glycosyltransferase family 2 protein [Patescibacteria group bacterium]
MEDNNLPIVSIIIPCRNEEKFIDKCLDSIISQNYSRGRLEILVVDGRSEDETRKIVAGYTSKYPFIKLLDNSAKITPVAMNIGIRKAKGDVIILVNAHSILDGNFLKYSIEYLIKTGADAVGGTLRTVNDNYSIIAQAIPLAADSVFGTGGRRYRTRTKEGWVKDTLPYCAYHKEIFKEIGLIDEELIRTQDAEFNYRILRHGGKIYYTPKIKSSLHIRPTLKKLCQQHFQYGYLRASLTQKIGILLTWRQLIPGAFTGSLAISLILSIIYRPFLWLFLFIIGSYIIVNLGFSLRISLKKGLRYFPVLPLTFVTLHFSYGIGYLKGIWDFMILKRYKKKKIK